MPRKYAAKGRSHRYRGQRKLNKRQKTQVKRLIGSRTESKIIDTAILNVADAAGVFQRLNTPAQGDAYNERAGDAIKLEKVSWRLSMTYADATNVLRMIVFRWGLDASVTSPTTSDVLQALNALAYPKYQTEVEDRVRILSDRTYALSQNGRPNMIVSGSLYGKKLGRKTLGFNQGTTNGVGQVFVLWISDSVAVSHPTIGGYFRMQYEDA